MGKQGIRLFWVIGIVGLIIVVGVIISQQNKAIDKVSDDYSNFVKTRLEADGYEVINFGLEDNIGFVKMKAFGDRTEQIKRGFMQLGVYYKTASEYKVTIMSDKSTCYYKLDGQNYREYLSNITAESAMLMEAKIKGSEWC